MRADGETAQVLRDLSRLLRNLTRLAGGADDGPAPMTATARLALVELGDGGPFRLNDLSVACHRHDPDYFGMDGYPHHPDNHKIHSFLYGRRGLIRRGHIERIDEGLFRVPEETDVGH